MEVKRIFPLKTVGYALFALAFVALGVFTFDRQIKTGAMSYPKPAIPAVDSHIHSQGSELDKMRYMSRVNNIRSHLVVGSADVTLKGRGGFVGFRKNNSDLLESSRESGGALFTLPTLDLDEDEAEELLRQYVKEGAIGLKLYDGHGNFYKKPLTAPEKKRIYKLCDELNIPILYHINLDKYGDQLESILAEFPNLKIIVPHFGLWSKKFDKLSALLDKFPNLYLDVSFGADKFTYNGLMGISKNNKKMREFLIKYRKRVLFGSDIVVTDSGKKTKQWCAGLQNCIREMLEKEEYRCPPLTQEIKKLNKDDELKERRLVKRDENPLYKGVNLPEEALRDILYRNAVRLYPKLAALFTTDELGGELLGELRKMGDKGEGKVWGRRVLRAVEERRKGVGKEAGSPDKEGSKILAPPERKRNLFKPLLPPHLRGKK
ncbi:MAG: hypothetical protein Kow0090_03440 [Myxococcota bacterium]